MSDPRHQTEDWVRAFYSHPSTFAVLTQGKATETIAERLWSLLELTAGARVFDQCCGSGSVALELARRGAPGVGVDISEPFISAGQAIAEAEQLPVELVAADASHWSSPLPCQAGFNWGTGFGCFAQDARNIAMLECAAASLEPGALYLLDYYNVAGVLAHFKPEFSYQRELDGEAVEVTRRSELDLAAGTLHQRWFLQPSRGPRVELPTTTTRLYLPFELISMLEGVGFRVQRLFGDARGAALDLASPRCMLLARRGP